jgi:long-chain acyl-CoA synthetase
MKMLTDIYLKLSHPDRAKNTFVHFEHEKLRYGQLVEQIGRLTSLFNEYGVTKGDRIVIASDDEEAVITLVCAALTNGICSIIMSPMTPATRAKALISKSKPALLIVDGNIKEQWQPDGVTSLGIDKRRSTRHRFFNKLMGKNTPPKGFHERVDSLPVTEPSLDIPEDQPALINFTSGTTKEPKGVQITYHSLFAHLDTIRRVFRYDSESRILNNMALAHVDGMVQGPLLTFFCGATLYRPCPLDVQHLEELLNTVYTGKISHFITPPTMLSLIDRLTSHDDYFEGDHFRHLISVAAMLDANLWQRLEKRFGMRICNMFGLTETVTGGLFCGPDDEFYKLGTVGKPIDISTRIVDRNMQPVPAETDGELLLKGDNVFPGYFGDEESTKEAFHEGWFRTGDLARQDADGFFQIRGRLKEMIISGGFNIHPAEVNEAILQHPAIAEVATIGRPDPDWQEIVVSAVVLKPDAQASGKDIIEHCRTLLEPYKVPKLIKPIKELPRGISGKVVMPELQTLLQKASKPVAFSSSHHDVGDFIALTAEAFDTEKENLMLEHGPDQISGWDSLGHLNLVTEVEKHFAIQLSPREVMSIESLNDLWRMVQQRG